MGSCKVILMLGVALGEIVELSAARVGRDGNVLAKTNELNELKYSASEENFDTAFTAVSSRKRARPAQSAERCGDDESYYFDPLDECYRIFRTPFLNVDPDHGIAYGGTRNEYMFRCWQDYRGKLLDIGLEHIGEKMKLVKEMVIDFNSRMYRRQAIQVGFMIDMNNELISQNGDHYNELDEIHVEPPFSEDDTSCPSVCCIVFLADIRESRVKMLFTGCDNRTRALSYICEAPSLTND